MQVYISMYLGWIHSGYASRADRRAKGILEGQECSFRCRSLDPAGRGKRKEDEVSLRFRAHQ